MPRPRSLIPAIVRAFFDERVPELLKLRTQATNRLFGSPAAACSSSQSSQSSSPAPARWVAVFAKGVNVRAEPRETAPVVAVLPPRAVVIERARRHEWLRHDAGWSIIRLGDRVALAPQQVRTVPSGLRALIERLQDCQAYSFAPGYNTRTGTLAGVGVGVDSNSPAWVRISVRAQQLRGSNEDVLDGAQPLLEISRKKVLSVHFELIDAALVCSGQWRRFDRRLISKTSGSKCLRAKRSTAACLLSFRRGFSRCVVRLVSRLGLNTDFAGARALLWRLHDCAADCRD